MEGVPCNLELGFDQNILRSPSSKISFTVISNDFPLFYSTLIGQLRTIGISFKSLSYAVMGTFVLSIAHKLMGAELLICCQIVYLSISFYKMPPIFLSPLKNFNIVTGDWSFFHKSAYDEMLVPFTQRVQISAYFIENTLFVLSFWAFLLIIMVSLFMMYQI